MASRIQDRILILGIDAANIRGGGGLTHLIELLCVAQPHKFNFTKVVIWSGKKTLDAINDYPWLVKSNPPALDKGLLSRTFWQCWNLSNEARKEQCDTLFIPGGSYAGTFFPFVTMSQNLLPFEKNAIMRYGWRWLSLKLILLRQMQTRTFKRANGVIFLTKYAHHSVKKVTGPLKSKAVIIPHGVNQRFRNALKLQRSIDEYGGDKPYRLLYVSTVDHYKNQWCVVEAVASLRQLGFPIVLDLVGSGYRPALQRLFEAMDRFDFTRKWVFYHGSIPFEDLHTFYAKADLGVFASSCENLPNILLEKMIAGLPIVCSRRGPMPEILGNAGLYFDPEQPREIANTIAILLRSTELRTRLAEEAQRRAEYFNWKTCAENTFSLLSNSCIPCNVMSN